MLVFLAILGCLLLAVAGFFAMVMGAMGSNLYAWFIGMIIMVVGMTGAFHIMYNGAGVELWWLSLSSGIAFFMWAFWSTFDKHY
jgi:hypothetical protein